MFELRTRSLIHVAAALVVAIATASATSHQALGQAPALTVAERGEVVSYVLTMDRVKRVLGAEAKLMTKP